MALCSLLAVGARTRYMHIELRLMMLIRVRALTAHTGTLLLPSSLYACVVHGVPTWHTKQNSVAS